jgi:hypothetical protein
MGSIGAQSFLKMAMEVVYIRLSEVAASDTGLVRDQEGIHARSVDTSYRFCGSCYESQVLRSVSVPLINDERAIAIKKDCSSTIGQGVGSLRAQNTLFFHGCVR